VRTVMTAVLIAIVSATIIEAPIMAAPASAPSAPLGVVLQSENAHVGTDVTYSGATIYDGDRLQTPEKGTLRVQLGTGQLVLRQSTIADVHAFPNGFSAELGLGSVIVSSAEGQTFQLIANGATIRPANSQPTSGQITRISPKALILTSTRGVLQVTLGDEVRTVDPGSSYRMELESDDSGPGPLPQMPHPTARNRFLWIAIPAVAVVTGVVMWRALVSPAGP
jgi:hypothetical protein